MVEKIGVFVCDCGNNIAEAIDTSALAEFAKTQPDVVLVKLHRLWCSEDGRQEMKDAITANGITRVVIAACSPKQHEHTFQKVLGAAGINPYLMQMANIREQIAWVTHDKSLATRKALAQLNAAIRRVRLQKPLEKPDIECQTDVVVIGAGTAGMTAALTLAQKNRHVFLVEARPWIGGRVVSYEDVFPNMECAPCMLEPKMDEVLHDEHIELLAYTDIVNVKGFFGNFEVQVRQKARYVDTEKCIGCGACYEPCPVTVKNADNQNLSERHAVYSAFAGVLPNAPIIDREQCLRFKGQECSVCQESCPFGAIDYTQQDNVRTIRAGAIVVATGFDVMPLSQIAPFAGLGPNCLTALQFERIISATGPTEGKVVRADGTVPASIALIHCAGSRDKNYKEYCSGICCAYSLKFAHLARKKAGDIKVYNIFSDWCLPGKGYQAMYTHIAPELDGQIRVANPNTLSVREENGSVIITHDGDDLVVDMAVFATAIVPSEGTKQIAAQLGIDCDGDGFLSPEHARMAPAASALRGIYIAGCATGPMGVPETVLQAQAAAALALQRLVPGEKLEVEAATAHVNEDLCSGCRVCVSLCPFQAIRFDEDKKISLVNEVLCRGCGVCAAACPAGAIENRHFTKEEIFTEIEGVLHER